MAGSIATTAIAFRIELTVPVGRGLALCGWLEDPHDTLRTVALYLDDGTDRQFRVGTDALSMLRGPRQENGRQDVVAWIAWQPDTKQMPMLTFNNQLADLDPLPAPAPATLLGNATLLARFGSSLRALALELEDHALLDQLEPRLSHLKQAQTPTLGVLEAALRLPDGRLLFAGRLDLEPGALVSTQLQVDKQAPKDVRHLMHLVSLPMQHAVAFLLLADGVSTGKVGIATLHLDTVSQGSHNLTARPQQANAGDLSHLVQQLPHLTDVLLSALRDSPPPGFGQLLQHLGRAAFQKQWSVAAAKCRHQDFMAATVSHSFALEEAGLLVYGGLVMPPHTRFHVWLHSPDQPPLEVTGQLMRLPSGEGGAKTLKAEFPEAEATLLYMLHVPIATAPDAPRLLRLSVAGLPDYWLKVTTAASPYSGAALAKQMLKPLLPVHEFRGRMLELFDRGLGPAIAWATRSRSEGNGREHLVQFGTPPTKPVCTVIIPLYGRCDFMRYQLAQFCDDPEFANVDLIYVVDDPALVQDALDMAGKYQPLFRVPLRVLHYGENRGFARANNTAAKHARAPLLLLMNSDVLPQAPGWIGALRRALNGNKGATMVGPLLQFADGSVQHAGMAAIRNSAYPGFVFSHHPGKGASWQGGEHEREVAMLTGACLLLRRSDFDAVGGFDEGYVVGDFEDSDLSLQLRKRGGKVLLVPRAKLWHLERKSQYLGQHGAAERDLLTLYNAWRYRCRIREGILPDPETLTVEAG